ncbi:YdeI family protein [Candidatus Eisenbacteria bacterium]|uniref:YdeI family protein n=1 Tax=Eiseniibacteriota bacterium TaxID=2212470 RepID=A0ABV6YP25_UNCEI
MPKYKQVYVTDRKQWRAWLKTHHASEREVWLIYYKKHTGKPRIPYDDAVEEALCYGWIDSTVRRLDDERYMQKFTPRNPRSVWSKLNKERALKMIEAKRMTRAGLERIEDARKSGAWDRAYETPRASGTTSPIEVPPELKKALAANKVAARNFENLAPSYRKQYIGWLLNAKREETRKKRTRVIVERAAQNKKPGMV